jgi:beta-lactamase class A
VTGTLAPGRTGVGPSHARAGGGGRRDTHQARPEPSLSPISEPIGQPTGGAAAGTKAGSTAGAPSTAETQPTTAETQPTTAETQPTAGASSAASSDPAAGAAGAASVTKTDPRADPFAAAVTSYLAGRAGTVAAAVYDVDTGQTWTLGPGSPQPTGSLVKLEILQALLARRPSGLPAADQARARSMIESNDNAPATVLWDQAGQAPGLRSYNASVGLRQTTPSACLACAGFAWPGWGLTTTTPADQVLLLRELISGPLLSQADRGYALSLMENVEPGQRWGVSGGVPPGVRVALKSAWVPLTPAGTDWQVNSEGWVSGDGRDYLVAILATGNPSEQYGIDTINTVSALLWPAMG